MAAAEAAAEASCAAVTAALLAGKPLDLPSHANLQARYQKDQIDKAAFFATTCRATMGDTDSPCDGLGQEEAKYECRLRWGFLRAARDPARSADLLAGAVHAFCSHAAPKANCAGIRDAVKAGDPARCPEDSRESSAICGALVWRDAAHCPKGDDEFTQGCATTARWTGALRSGGLAQLAFVGTPEEQALARAAAGQIDACKALIESFKRDCLKTALSSRPGGGGPGSTGPGPGGGSGRDPGAGGKPAAK